MKKRNEQNCDGDGCYYCDCQIGDGTGWAGNVGHGDLQPS